MTRIKRAELLFLAPVLLSVAGSAMLAAQRGGRGGGARPATTSVYQDDVYGMKFPVPPGLELYTESEPGPYSSTLRDRRIIYLVGPDRSDVTIGAKYSTGVTEADLKGYKDILDASPPQAKLPGFKKISVQFVKIGTRGDKDAVDYVYRTQDGALAVITRQVVFLHNGKGFTFTCVAPEPRYPSADKRLFAPLFAGIEFR